MHSKDTTELTSPYQKNRVSVVSLIRCVDEALNAALALSGQTEMEEMGCEYDEVPYIFIHR